MFLDAQTPVWESIVLARENGAMIARATSWQQAVATRP